MKRKKAFTLTELLVVVVIIGVLSAVVLPKFTKIIETRKTTEAENIMSAVRNEQEARCMIGKNYTADSTKLASLPSGTSKHFTYSLDSQGITATKSGEGGSKLKIPSYTDGRICCEGEGCNKLNKNYLSCDATFEPAACKGSKALKCGDEHYTGEEASSSACECGGTKYTRYTCVGGSWTTYIDDSDCTPCPTPECEPGQTDTRACSDCGTKTRTCGSDGTWGTWSECPTDCGCTPGETKSQTCNVCGTQTSTCGDDRTWGEYGECSKTLLECLKVEQSDCDPNTKPSETRDCGCEGTQTRTVTCKSTTLENELSGPENMVYSWVTGLWGKCEGEKPQNCPNSCLDIPEEERECSEGEVKHTGNNICTWIVKGTSYNMNTIKEMDDNDVAMTVSEHQEASGGNASLDGKNIALVSDAGTPGISDPGEVIIKKAIENNPWKIIPNN